MANFDMTLHPASVKASKDLVVFMECLQHLLHLGCSTITAPLQPGDFAEAPEMKLALCFFS